MKDKKIFGITTGEAIFLALFYGFAWLISSINLICGLGFCLCFIIGYFYLALLRSMKNKNQRKNK